MSQAAVTFVKPASYSALIGDAYYTILMGRYIFIRRMSALDELAMQMSDAKERHKLLMQHITQDTNALHIACHNFVNNHFGITSSVDFPAHFQLLQVNNSFYAFWQNREDGGGGGESEKS